MTESEFRETVLRLVASPVDGLSFEDKAAIVRDAVTAKEVMSTAGAKVQLLRNVLLLVLGILTLVGGVAVTVSLTWDVPLFFALLGSLLALWVILVIVMLGGWLRGRNTSGSVLLDLGPNPARGSSRKAAWSVGALAVTLGVTTWWLSKAAAVAIIAGAGLFAAFFILMGSGRLQMRENGLWVYFSLLRWGEIGSWRWEGDSALWVKTRGFFSWFQRILTIPPGQRQEVHELLLKHCSAEAPTNQELQQTGAA